jgi:hypothetical protein
MRMVVAAICIAACGDDRTSSATVGGSGAASMADVAATDGLGASETGANTQVGGLGSSSDGDGGLDGTTSTGAGEDSDPRDDGWPDVPPFPEECYEPVAVLEITQAQSPDGPLYPSEAWIQADACGGPPHLILFQPASLEHGPEVEVDVAFGGGDSPFDGTLPANIHASGPDGTIEFLEPFDVPVRGTLGADHRLHARIEIHGGGWDLSLEVDLVYCGAEGCYCPCR